MEVADGFPEGGEFADKGEGFEVFLERFGGDAPVDDAAAFEGLSRQDTALGAEDGAGLDGDVIAEADLSADDGVMFDDGAAGDAGLGGDDNVCADAAVVADVDQVIEFDAILDDGGAEGGAVNGGVGADLDIVADDETADLREVGVAAILEDEAEAVGAEDGAGVDDGASAHLDTGIEGHPGV